MITRRPGPPDTKTTKAQNRGGKKETNSLIILQTFLLLNTFLTQYKYRMLYKNSHDSVTLLWQSSIFNIPQKVIPSLGIIVKQPPWP